MVTLNPFFRNTNFTNEQRLIESLSIEMIKIHGVDVFYMPRTHVNIDGLFLQDPLSNFKEAIRLEMYIKNFEGWSGEGDLMSKFGISMADQITFCVARKRFNQAVGSYFNMIRPLEGDLIYFPIPKAIFEIKFVEHESTFYQTGSLQVYELKCERFNYNDEEISTGIDEIDDIQVHYDTSSTSFRLHDTAGNTLLTTDGRRIVLAEYIQDKIDQSVQNEYLEDASETFITFNSRNPFAE